VIGELACGAQLSMVVSQVAGSGADNGVRLFGTRGELHVVGDGLVLHGRDAAEPRSVAADGAGWRVEEEFVGAIRGTEPVRRTTVADGLRYMAFTQAVRRSVDEHRQVSLGEL
jgi:predicted dehydrogenase